MGAKTGKWRLKPHSLPEGSPRAPPGYAFTVTSEHPHAPAAAAAPAPSPAEAATPAEAAAPAATRKPPFRTDIHGLRGLAVVLVVLYHVFVGRVSGGVDVFLFISAYFLTTTFLTRLRTGHPIAPVQYWGRTFKRLLPPTVVVTLVTVAAALWLLPASERDSLLADAFSTLIQAENWHLISQATNYYAADRTVASPFQHFWSLSIQGQVFLFWPLMFALIALLLRATARTPHCPASRSRSRSRSRSHGAPSRALPSPRCATRLSATVIGLLTAASFAWSVYETATMQQVAYFDTFARLWEFGLGALMAIILPSLARRSPLFDPRSPRARRPRFLISLFGVLTLVSMGFLVDVAGQFPGWLALWPLSAAILVMAVGYNPLLSSRPLQFLGSISYGLYLVHWPLLIITLHVLGKPESGKKLGLLLVALSVLLAWLLTKFVDTPFRRWTWAGARTYRSVSVAVGSVAVGLCVVLSLQSLTAYQTAERERLAYANNPGARVLAADFRPHPQADPNAQEIPGAAGLKREWFGLPEECEGRFATEDPLLEMCRTQLATTRPEEAPTMVLWGNSRMEQLSAAIAPALAEERWNALALFKGGCAPALHDGAECDAFTQASLEYILALKPEAVALQTTFVPREGSERSTPELEQIVARLRAEGIAVVAVRDQPRLAVNLVQCREKQGQADGCTDQPSRNMPAERPDIGVVKASASDEGVVLVDLTEWICPDDLCVPAIGNVTVFLDADHITKTYSASMEAEAARQVNVPALQG